MARYFLGMNLFFFFFAFFFKKKCYFCAFHVLLKCLLRF